MSSALARRPPRIDAPPHVRAARRVLVWVLCALARTVLRRYRPVVVAVTGSVGKTTTTQLVALMLGVRYRVRATDDSWNNEVGAPATVLGGTRARTARDWLRILARGVGLVVRRVDYPDVLVLELGAGRPGELERITRTVRPDVAVVTNVRPVHLEHFPGLDGIVREKAWVVRRLKPEGIAVLNVDDPATRTLAEVTAGRTTTYALEADADVSFERLAPTREGVSGVVRVRGRDGHEPARCAVSTRLLGTHQASSVLAAVAVAAALDVPLAAAAQAVEGFEAAPGRLRAVPGTGEVTVLDGSYNASPGAVLDALRVLALWPPPRHAVLGEMRELGAESERSHREVGAFAAGCVDDLITVGRDAERIAEGALDAGMEPGRVVAVASWQDATRAADRLVRTGTVLVKGSRAVGLEHVVATLTAGGAEVV